MGGSGGGKTAGGSQGVPAGEAGELFVVSTPIGNLGDLTARAAEVLKQVDLVAAEDTRRTRVLFAHYAITTPMTPYHEHNAQRALPKLLARLQAGGKVALVSDAGTPTLSDPGFKLIRAAVESGVRITPVPGASAALAALVGAGLPTDRFVFEGFLPRKKGRKTRIAALAEEPRTIVLFESPMRIEKTLSELAEAFGGERPAALCRELTKRYEEFWRGGLADLAARAGRTPPKGEIVLVIGGREKRKGGREASQARVASGRGKGKVR